MEKVDMPWKREDTSSQVNPSYSFRESLAWDSAIFTHPGVLDLEELFGSLNIRELENMPEPEKTDRKIQFISRGSITWDSAFFSNQGVLDPEELSRANKGFKKSEVDILPKAEESQTSVDSSYTAGGGRLSFTSLEVGLFDDTILKSSNITNVKAKRGNMKHIRASKELDGSSQRRTKPLSSSMKQKQNISNNGHSRSRERRLVTQSLELNPFSPQRPPKILRRSINSTAPARLTSSSHNHVKLENKSSVPAFGSSLKANESTSKSAMNYLRKKVDPKVSTSDSDFKTPLRHSIGRSELASSRQAKSSVSTPTGSSQYSLANESSSRSASLRKRSSSSMSSFDMSNCSSTPFGSDTSKGSEYEKNRRQLCVTKGNKTSGLRVPFPKMGFFDLDKSSTPKENRAEIASSEMNEAATSKKGDKKSNCKVSPIENKKSETSTKSDKKALIRAKRV